MKEDDIRAMLEIVSQATSAHPDFNFVSVLYLPEKGWVTGILIGHAICFPFHRSKKRSSAWK